jgi:hypothetical protein
MGDDLQKDIGIRLDPEIEAPVTDHPHLSAFRIVLLGAQRGMPHIVKKKSHLHEEGSFDSRWCVGVGPIKVASGANLH